MIKKENAFLSILFIVYLLSTTTTTTTATTTTTTVVNSLVTIEKQQQRELQQQQQNSDRAFRLGTVGYGIHYVELWVGTPPQRQRLIVDTVSNLAGFPCSTCSECTGTSFVEQNSKSFLQTPCNTCEKDTQCESNSCIMHYHHPSDLSSSWDAYEARDIAFYGIRNEESYKTLINTKNADPYKTFEYAFKFSFGCQTKVSLSPQQQLLLQGEDVNGMLGMNKNFVTMWGQMYRENILKHRSFSLCFGRQTIGVDSEVGDGGGAMTLGGYDERLHDTPIMYTTTTTRSSSNSSNFPEDDNFYVHIRKLHLRDGESNNNDNDAEMITLNIPETSLNIRPISIQSGSAYTYLPKAFSAPFKNAFYRLTEKQYTNDGIYMMTENEVRSLPTILLQLSGDERNTNTNKLDLNHPYDVILAIPPSQYMEHSKGSKIYTARIYAADENNEMPPLLGANAMMGRDIYFDVEENRIGWAESYSCRITTTNEGKTPNQTTTPIQKETSRRKRCWYCHDSTTLGVILGSSLTILAIGVYGKRFLRSHNRVVYETVMGLSECELQELSTTPTVSEGGGGHYELVPEN